ncbi:hypothetical protein CC80DRAFT_536350 [Byssothecium circinans]|uniref:Uncharacterized protein n=1 Tax=Byssothecium circinans TaxID=147558 RepID=A0A6A5U2M1_9PLEO|nr:hypothetical protein CC80DRAFT_536350 [Byssothecium circinans]
MSMPFFILHDQLIPMVPPQAKPQSSANVARAASEAHSSSTKGVKDSPETPMPERSYHQLEDMVKMIYRDSIPEDELKYFIAWLHNRPGNLELAQQHIRELRCDQSYNSSRLKSTSLRKLIDSTVDIRPRALRDNASPDGQSSDTEAIVEAIAATNAEAPKVEPSPSKDMSAEGPVKLKAVDIMQAARDIARTPFHYPDSAEASLTSKNTYRKSSAELPAAGHGPHSLLSSLRKKFSVKEQDRSKPEFVKAINSTTPTERGSTELVTPSRGVSRSHANTTPSPGSFHWRDSMATFSSNSTDKTKKSVSFKSENSSQYTVKQKPKGANGEVCVARSETLPKGFRAAASGTSSGFSTWPRTKTSRLSVIFDKETEGAGGDPGFDVPDSDLPLNRPNILPTLASGAKQPNANVASSSPTRSSNRLIGRNLASSSTANGTGSQQLPYASRSQYKGAYRHANSGDGSPGVARRYGVTDRHDSAYASTGVDEQSHGHQPRYELEPHEQDPEFRRPYQGMGYYDRPPSVLAPDSDYEQEDSNSLYPEPDFASYDGQREQDRLHAHEERTATYATEQEHHIVYNNADGYENRSALVHEESHISGDSWVTEGDTWVTEEDTLFSEHGQSNASGLEYALEDLQQELLRPLPSIPGSSTAANVSSSQSRVRTDPQTTRSDHFVPDHVHASNHALMRMAHAASHDGNINRPTQNDVSPQRSRTVPRMGCSRLAPPTRSHAHHQSVGSIIARLDSMILSTGQYTEQEVQTSSHVSTIAPEASTAAQGEPTSHRPPRRISIPDILSTISVVQDSANSSDMLLQNFRLATEALLTSAFERTRRQALDLLTIDWAELSRADRDWRTANEAVLVTVYGANDTELSAADRRVVDRIAAAFRGGLGTRPGFEFVGRIFGVDECVLGLWIRSWHVDVRVLDVFDAVGAKMTEFQNV